MKLPTQWCLADTPTAKARSHFRVIPSRLPNVPAHRPGDTPMQDVPASYLHWLWTNGKKDDKTCKVADYIRRNLNTLKQEHRDGIWA